MPVNAAPAPAPAAVPAVDPVQEIRFAVVIYGGVSLAVYINGVAQEMLSMVRATAPESPSSTAPLLPTPTSSEKVYRKLGQIIGDLSRTPAQMHAALKDDDPVITRFVIDVLSGTSAGGINAIFLAKALANNQTMDGLRDLWITEGDISVLINDRMSLADPGRRLEPQPSPRSLLNGQRLYLKLLDALDAMDNTAPTIPSPLVDQLDLFSTTTDIAGLTSPIALADRVVEERRHRNVFHFRYPSSESPHGTDFRVDDNPFLAFAARCTSAFPFAFEPMTLGDVFPIVRTTEPHRHADYCDPRTACWQRFYTEYLGSDNPDRLTLAFDQRAFGDGGYLDNKPFSYAIDAVFTRHAELPVARKLVYVEPKPEHLRGLTNAGPPDAIENAIAALVTLPRYETVREDLERVIERNVKVDRLNHLIQAIESDLDAPDSGVAPDAWLGSRDSAQRYGGGYAVYERLKVSSVTDDLVDLIARAMAIDVKSGYASAMRLLASIWRNDTYPHDTEQRQFLLDFDINYRLRRLRYLRRQINEWARNAAEPAAVRDELKEIKRTLKRPHDALQALIDRPRNAADFSAAAELFPARELELVMEPPQRLAGWPGLERYAYVLEASPRGRQQRAVFVVHDLGRGKSIDAIASALKQEFVPVFKQASAEVQPSFADAPGLTPEAGSARQRVRDLYKRFEAHDAALFPITYGTDLGEDEAIEIFRISPDDAVARRDDVPISGSKVKGQALGSFAGFLDQTWRENDILWGRLDGAERIVSALLPGGDDETVALRRALVDEAHQAIVEERFPLKYGVAVDWKLRLADFVASEVRKEPEPELMAASAARATAVTGAVLEGIADKRRVSRRPFAYLALAGRIAWEFVEVASPRTLSSIVFVYWLQVLLVSALLVALAGVVLRDPDVRGFGESAIAVLLAVYFVRRALRRFLAGRPLLTATTLTVGTIIATVAIAALLGNADHLASAASGSAAWLRNTIDSWHLAARAGSALASGLKYLIVSALLCTCLTGAIAAWFASKIDPPPGPRRPRRPMLALERASTWQEARDVLGSDGHGAREQVRRALIAGYPFVAAFTLLFVAIGLSAASAGSTAGWVLAGTAVISGVSDVLENKAIAAVLRNALPRPFSPDAPLAPAPRPFALVKWASVAIATALALMLVAPPWLGKLFGSGR